MLVKYARTSKTQLSHHFLQEVFPDDCPRSGIPRLFFQRSNANAWALVTIIHPLAAFPFNLGVLDTTSSI